tara:strand:- start:25715 stop:25909 length:195 start_codon:yes stop_codon:yes gene_type:complete
MKNTLTWAKKLTRNDSISKAFPHHYITRVENPDGSIRISLLPKNVQTTNKEISTVAEVEETSEE